MSALENFTPLELALLAIIITGYIYHRRSLQNHTNNSPSETGSQTDSSKLLPRKCYISSKTQTLGKVEDKTDKSNPYGKIVLCEGDQSELEDDYIEYEEQFDYFAKAYTELTESEKRVRLGLLIHSGTGLLDVLRPQGIVREPLPDQNPSPQAGLLARMSTALPQVIRPGKGEVEENTRVILAAFCKIFKDKYAAGFSVMGKQGSEAIDLFVCQDSVSKDEREDASNRTTGVKDDHGDRFKVPRLQNQAKSASGSVSVEGHLEAAIKAKGQIDHFVAVTDILNSYQLATETEEKLQIRDVLQRYVLFCCRDEMEMRFNLSYEVVKGKEGYKSPFRLKDTFTRIYFSERTTKDIRWPSQKDLEAFRLDERSLQACFDECKVEFRFTPDNFIDLDRHSIATFHTFFTRLLTLVDCSLRYLDPENLRTLSADKTVPPFLRKHDEKSRAISLKAFAKTQAHLQAFGDLVLRSRSFQIYLHQPEVKAALRKKYTYASYGSYGAEVQSLKFSFVAICYPQKISMQN
ncbi:hypothetical protein BJ508DRAFT_138807 [Ascobolus immersus RN42]|uniref:Uncharacterized protein n=1 Tax=Ascobolus immersus RN42 TaxID=1160509 RepID=A0A3N4I2I5_ASCIM|nr:hypothetical protein BJ508DRAFT_138807 [Ascobolus immersus RN42]